MYSPVPIFTAWQFIYEGPHIDTEGKLDERVWFSIPVDISQENASITYLIFPFGGKEEEIEELVVEATGTWIG